MSDVPMSRANFLKALMNIQMRDGDPALLTEKLRQAVLDFASETPDNIACASRFEVSAVGQEFGIKVHDHPLLYCDIAHAVEDMPMPETIRTTLPDLTEADWYAFTRLTTLVYILLQRPLERSTGNVT